MKTGRALNNLQLIDLTSSVEEAHWLRGEDDAERRGKFGTWTSQDLHLLNGESGGSRMPASHTASPNEDRQRLLAPAKSCIRKKSNDGSIPERNRGPFICGIQEVELLCNGMVLDLRGLCNSGVAISIDSLQMALDAVGREILPGDAVLLRTGQEAYTSTDLEYFNHPVMSPEGTLFLTTRGARVLGIDTPSWDHTLPLAQRQLRDINGFNQHMAGDAGFNAKEVCVVAHLSNLEFLPLCGFKVVVSPVQHIGDALRPCRVLAYLEQNLPWSMQTQKKETK